MRPQLSSRRIYNSIMKSPSPDIANRNIITATKMPIDQVERHFQKSLNQKNSRLRDKSQSIKVKIDSNDVKFYRQKIKELEIKVGQLMNQNEQYRKGFEQKFSMQEEITRLKETLRLYENAHNLGGKEQKELKMVEQLQERVIQLYEQNKRLGGILESKQTNIQFITSQNERLKTQISNLKSQLSPNKAIIHKESTSVLLNPQSLDTQALANYLQDLILGQMKRKETEWANKIEEHLILLYKVQQRLRYLQNQIIKRDLFITSVKRNQYLDSQTRADIEQSEYISGIHQPKTIKPFNLTTISSIDNESSHKNQVHYLYKQNQSRRPAEIDHIIELEAKCERLERQNLNQMKKTFQLQDQVRRLKQASISAFTLPANQNLQKRVSTLEDEIDSKAVSLKNAQKNLSSIREDYSRLTNQNNTYKKAMEEERQKLQEMEIQFNKVNYKCHDLEYKLQEKNQRSEEDIRRLKLSFEEREADIRQQYEDAALKKDRDIAKRLHEYLQVLRSLRNTINDMRVDQVIKYSEMAINDKITIEKQIAYIRDENQRIIHQLKTKVIHQEQKIIELQKDNQLFRAEVHELQVQKQKLKKAMLQFEVFKPVAANLLNGTNFKNNYNFEHGCRLKTCIEDAKHKTQNLEHRIAQILHEQR